MKKKNSIWTQIPENIPVRIAIVVGMFSLTAFIFFILGMRGGQNDNLPQFFYQLAGIESEQK